MNLNKRIVIFNNLGQKMIEFDNINSGINTLNISDLQAGIYLVQVFNGSELITRDLTKH